METALIVAVIAGSVAALGWLTTHILALRLERKRSNLASQVAHIGAQLQQLYGPLVFLMHEGTYAFRDLLQTLGRDHVFRGNLPLPPEEQALWLFWVDNDLMPRNAAIQALLAKHSHLIEGPDIPASYLDFLDHYNSWQVSHLRWKEEGIPYSWHSKRSWPVNFEREVVGTFRNLKRKYATLIGEA